MSGFEKVLKNMESLIRQGIIEGYELTNQGDCYRIEAVDKHGEREIYYFNKDGKEI